MRFAEKIEFQDSPPVVVGNKFSGYEVTRIEIYQEEYEGHSELTALWYHDTTEIGRSWMIPLVITYKV